MKSCPICSKQLKFNQSVHRNFTWSNPTVTCTNCNFNYVELVADHSNALSVGGHSCFEHEKSSKDAAEQILFNLFDIKVETVVVKTERKFY